MKCTACGESIGKQPYEPIEIKFRANNHKAVDGRAGETFARTLNQDALLCLRCASKVALLLGGAQIEVKK